jgi:hypothetical protein
LKVATFKSGFFVFRVAFLACGLKASACYDFWGLVSAGGGGACCFSLKEEAEKNRFSSSAGLIQLSQTELAK